MIQVSKDSRISLSNAVAVKQKALETKIFNSKCQNPVIFNNKLKQVRNYEILRLSNVIAKLSLSLTDTFSSKRATKMTFFLATIVNHLTPSFKAKKIQEQDFLDFRSSQCL